MPTDGIPIDVLIGAWVATGLTLFIYTFLYRDNPLFKLGEHLYVGISVGYSIVITIYAVGVKLLWVPMTEEGQWQLLIPSLLGLMISARFFPRIAWLSRISFAFVVGFGSGTIIPRLISSNVLSQLEDTIRPLATMTASGLTYTINFLDPKSDINNLITLIGVLSVLFYFFFSVEHRGAGQAVARTGIVFLMIAFGAAFGYTVMSRMSLLIGRFDDLIIFSGAEYGRPTFVLLVLTIGVLVYWAYREKQTPQTTAEEKS
ncbi:MAG: hypothetical protein CMH81_01555 [Nitrospiraceae bacterium]|mgnify:CR=1 FL=1|jgi:hypothetical protein|nr:hypothetical protein [Nitrospiraceae bacterium]|tara:strand:+ start:247 stop:1023 length:777 start_codon:yes stop_codon:yes gene_type:complete